MTLIPKYISSLFYPLGLVFFLAILCSGRACAFNAKTPFDISADVIDFVDASQEMTAEGHVEIVQTSSTLNADYVHYDRAEGHMQARGHVILHESGRTFFGDVLEYDLTAETGTLQSGMIYAAPWRLQAHSWEKWNDYYVGRATAFTSCDLVDPHYYIRSSRLHVVPDQFFWAWNNRFYVNNLPVLYSPFLYRNLGPKRIVFQAQPGNDTVDGAFVKTTTTLRLTTDVYDKVLLDEYADSGTGFGNELDYRNSDKLKGSLFAYYINPRADENLTGAPNTPQYNVRSYHVEQFDHHLSLQSNVNIRKNVSFNNQYFQQDTNQAVNDVNSSIALTQQTRKINQRLVVEALQAPDAADTSTFANVYTQSASLPRYEFTTFQVPLWAPKVSSGTTVGKNGLPAALAAAQRIGPLNFSINGSLGEDYERQDGQTRTKGNTQMTFSQTIPLSRDWTFTPSFLPQLSWQDKYDPLPVVSSVISSTAPVVIPQGFFRGYQGRLGSTQLLRYRPFSSLTLDQTYSYTARLEANNFALDRSLPDGGTETNIFNWLLFWRPSRSILMRSYTGYDLRSIADEPLDAYRQRRVSPWTSEITLEPAGSAFDYFFREQLSWWPTRGSLWEADAHYEGPHRTSLETGLLYNNAQPGELTWNNRIGLYASTGWRVDTIFHSFIQDGKAESIGRSSMIDTELIVIRDMHCWQTEFVYRDRAPFTQEFSFLVNLKLGAKATPRDVADQEMESEFYPWRDREYSR